MNRLRMLCVVGVGLLGTSLLRAELPAQLPTIPMIPVASSTAGESAKAAINEVTKPMPAAVAPGNTPAAPPATSSATPAPAAPPVVSYTTQPHSAVTNPVATMQPSTVSPWPANCVGPTLSYSLMTPLPVTPTVPPPTAAQVCESNPGVCKQMLSWLRGAGRAKSCNTVDPTCPMPQVHVPQLASNCATGACPTRPSIGHRGLSLASRERLKAWFHWKPCQEQLIPILQPVPYEAPIRAYVRDCKEPTAGVPCVKEGKKCNTASCPTPTASCPTNTCATAQPRLGPISLAYFGIGSKWDTKSTTGATVTPASATIPVPAIPTQQNPLVRPFTSP